jgi:hypothetical protein
VPPSAIDIDLGSAPAWVAALTAVVVGAFTILNVRTARRAYVEGKWDRKVAQARLVWVERHGYYRVTAEGQQVDLGITDMPPPDARITDVRFIELRDQPGAKSSTEESQVPVWTMDILRFFVKITNNSKEPIGEVNVRVHVFDRILAEGKRGRLFEVIPPEDWRMVEIHLPAGRHDADDFRLSLTFTDSAGHRWWRMETRPPKEMNPDS